MNIMSFNMTSRCFEIFEVFALMSFAMEVFALLPMAPAWALAPVYFCALSMLSWSMALPFLATTAMISVLSRYALSSVKGLRLRSGTIPLSATAQSSDPSQDPSRYTCVCIYG